MNLHSPTYLVIFLKPENEEHALYLIGESFSSTTHTIVDTQAEKVTWGTVFVLIHKEKSLTLALSAPVLATWDIRSGNRSAVNDERGLLAKAREMRVQST